jgi:hypothetical protein
MVFCSVSWRQKTLAPFFLSDIFSQGANKFYDRWTEVTLAVVYLSIFKWFPCHQGAAHSQVVDGGDGLQIWSVVADSRQGVALQPQLNRNKRN